MSRGKLAHPLPRCLVQPSLPFKRRVNLQESVVGGLALRVEDHLDDAEPFIHRVEQAAIERLALAERFFGSLLLSDVTAHHHRPDDCTLMVSDRTKAVAPDPRLARILAAQAVFLVGSSFSPQRPRNRPHLQRSQLSIGHRHFKEFWIFG